MSARVRCASDDAAFGRAEILSSGRRAVAAAAARVEYEILSSAPFCWLLTADVRLFHCGRVRRPNWLHRASVIADR